MRLRHIITLLLTGSILSGAALGFLVLNVAPGASALIPMLLTLLLFFCVLGLVSSVLIALRSRGERAWRSQFNLNVSVRQGTVIGALAALCLWLARFDILSFWFLVVILFIVGFIEYRLLPPSLRDQRVSND